MVYEVIFSRKAETAIKLEIKQQGVRLEEPSLLFRPGLLQRV
jgi:hypothetical protein